MRGAVKSSSSFYAWETILASDLREPRLMA